MYHEWLLTWRRNRSAITIQGISISHDLSEDIRALQAWRLTSSEAIGFTRWGPRGRPRPICVGPKVGKGFRIRPGVIWLNQLHIFAEVIVVLRMLSSSLIEISAASLYLLRRLMKVWKNFSGNLFAELLLQLSGAENLLRADESLRLLSRSLRGTEKGWLLLMLRCFVQVRQSLSQLIQSLQQFIQLVLICCCCSTAVVMHGETLRSKRAACDERFWPVDTKCQGAILLRLLLLLKQDKR